MGLINNRNTTFGSVISSRIGARSRTNSVKQGGQHRIIVLNFGSTVSVPEASRHPESWIMAQNGAQLKSSGNNEADSNIYSAYLTLAKLAESSINAQILISSADLGLIVDLISAINATGLITPPSLAATLYGELSATSGSYFTVTLGALVGASAIIAAIGDFNPSSGALPASISADIQPYTDLSPESLAKAVWDHATLNPKDGTALKELVKKLGKVDFLALK